MIRKLVAFTFLSILILIDNTQNESSVEKKMILNNSLLPAITFVV